MRFPTQPAAVIFDCDGPLVDSETCWTRAESALFARHGLPFGPAQKQLMIGQTLADAALTMETAFGRPGEADQLVQNCLTTCGMPPGRCGGQVCRDRPCPRRCSRGVPRTSPPLGARSIKKFAGAVAGNRDRDALAYLRDQVQRARHGLGAGSQLFAAFVRDGGSFGGRPEHGAGRAPTSRRSGNGEGAASDGARGRRSTINRIGPARPGRPS